MAKTRVMQRVLLGWARCAACGNRMERGTEAIEVQVDDPKTPHGRAGYYHAECAARGYDEVPAVPSVHYSVRDGDSGPSSAACYAPDGQRTSFRHMVTCEDCRDVMRDVNGPRNAYESRVLDDRYMRGEF